MNNLIIKEKKNKIVEIIKQKGPLLPIQIYRDLGLTLLVTSALLSEMVSERVLKISHIKLGNSPLYFLPGQEHLLEKFVSYLNDKEKEAFSLLKNRQVLQDTDIQPVYRVALRNIKDFAIPMKVNINGEERIFWRFYMLPKDNAVEEIRRKIYGKQEYKETEKREKKSELEKERKREGKVETPFKIKVYEYLKKKNIEIIEEREMKKKNITLRVILESNIGKIEMLVIAKDKKIVTQNDLTLALSEGQKSKLPVLLLSSGKISKRLNEEIENFKSYLFFRQI